MKKSVLISFIIVIIVIVLVFGFFNIIKKIENKNNKTYSISQHYKLENFKNKDTLFYQYPVSYGQVDRYMFAEMTTMGSESNSFLAGIFLEVADNDYILLDKIEMDLEDLLKRNAHFYEDKLYITSFWFPYVAKLNKDNTKIEKLNFKYLDTSNIYLFTSIVKIENNYIYYNAFDSGSGPEDDFSGVVKCNLNSLECEKDIS